MHELDTTISQKSPDKYLESATSRTIDVIKHGLEHQSALDEVTDNSNKMRETLRVYESKIRSLEFELGREKGMHVLVLQRLFFLRQVPAGWRTAGSDRTPLVVQGRKLN